MEGRSRKTGNTGKHVCGENNLDRMNRICRIGANSRDGVGGKTGNMF